MACVIVVLPAAPARSSHHTSKSRLTVISAAKHFTTNARMTGRHI
jgi:hypothetical protein